MSSRKVVFDDAEEQLYVEAEGVYSVLKRKGKTQRLGRLLSENGVRLLSTKRDPASNQYFRVLEGWGLSLALLEANLFDVVRIHLPGGDIEEALRTAWLTRGIPMHKGGYEPQRVLKRSYFSKGKGSCKLPKPEPKQELLF